MANWQLWASFLLKIKIEWKQKLDGFLFNENITLIFIFHQMVGSPSKTMKNVFLFHLKSSFRFRDIQILVFSSSPPSFPVSHCPRAWCKKSLKIHDVINCLINKNLITHFVRYHTENVHQKLAPDSFLILINNQKQPLHAINSFKSKVFWKRITKKALKKLSLFFLSNPVPIKNKRGLELVTSHSSGYETSSEKFLYSLYNIWPSLKMKRKAVFELFKNYIYKFMQVNSWHHNYSTSICPFKSGKCGKEGKNNKNLNISSFLDGIKHF